MRGSLLALLLAACNPTTAGTDHGSQGTVSDGDVDARLDALEEAVDAANATAAQDEARISALETEVAAQDSTIADLDSRLDTCETDLGDLGTTLESLSLTLDGLGDQVDALTAASGTPVWSTSASGTTGGRTSSWTSLGSDVDLSVTRVDPIFAWCNALEASGYGILRISLTSSDGSWSVTSTASDIDYHTADLLIPAVTVFTPPEAGHYTLSCEGRLSAAWTQYDLIAVQATGVVE